MSIYSYCFEFFLSLYHSFSSPTDLPNILTPLSVTNVSIGAYANSDPTNSTFDWLPIIVCTSQIGGSNTPNCRGVIISPTASGPCYVRLDIQIAYTNIGSVFNPQHVLSAVIYYYQYLVSESCFQIVNIIDSYRQPVQHPHHLYC